MISKSNTLGIFLALIEQPKPKKTYMNGIIHWLLNTQNYLFLTKHNYLNYCKKMDEHWSMPTMNCAQIKNCYFVP